MQIRCYRCGWSFALKKQEVQFALEALQETDGQHYDVPCPRCRHKNRVSLEQLKKAIPQATPDEPTDAS
jgi:DNA-directed RNA polymerase subunit RPC12/RpoP